MVPMECKGHAPRINSRQTVLLRAADQGSGWILCSRTVQPNGVWLWGLGSRRLGSAVRCWLVRSMIRRTRNRVVPRQVGIANGCDQRLVLRILLLWVRPLGGQPGHRPGLHFENQRAWGPAERVCQL